MKLAVIIPDREDRPKFLMNCMRLMKAQTIQPETIMLVHDPAKDDKCDITMRYRLGYEILRNRNFDVIAFIENDDWYAPTYLERQVAEWDRVGRPNLFGIRESLYYHIKLKKYYINRHAQRSCAMNTLIQPDLNINWGMDHNPYLDLQLWMNSENHSLTRELWAPSPLISVGIKHGIGKLGGDHHVNRLERYTTTDDHGFLRGMIDEESYKFYEEIQQEI